MLINSQQEADDYLAWLRANEGFDAERYAKERAIEMAESMSMFNYEVANAGA